MPPNHTRDGKSARNRNCPHTRRLVVFVMHHLLLQPDAGIGAQSNIIVSNFGLTVLQYLSIVPIIPTGDLYRLRLIGYVDKGGELGNAKPIRCREDASWGGEPLGPDV